MSAIPLSAFRDTSSHAVTLPRVLVALTALTGLVDALSYLGMGHVLVANMTGNIVFLGFAVAGTAGFSIPAFIVSLGGFAAGAVLGGRLAGAADDRRQWLTTSAAIQTMLTVVAAVAVAVGALSPYGTTRLGVIALLAVGMGLQNATVRRLAIPDLTTTVLTLTLTGLAADSRAAGGDNPRVGRRITATAAMLLGAIAGALLLRDAGFTTTLAVLAALYALIAIGFAVHVEEAPA